MGKHAQQVIGAFDPRRASLGRRWHRRVWFLVGEGCFATPIPGQQATPVPAATPDTPTFPQATARSTDLSSALSRNPGSIPTKVAMNK